MYTFRLIKFCLVINYRGRSFLRIREEWNILKRIILLVIISVFGGRILRWLIFPLPVLIILPIILKLLTLIVCILGGLGGYFIFNIFKLINLKIFKLIELFNIFFSLMWFIPYISTILLNEIVLLVSLKYIKRVDFGWNEILRGKGLYLLLNNRRIILIKFYFKNYFKNYFLIIVFFFIIFIIK